MISILVPHRNRVSLFEKNLESLYSQTDKDFEVIVADNSDQGGWDHLKIVAQRFKNMGLKIKLYRVDPRKCEFAHDGSQYGGMFNPCIQQNVALKKASGEVVVLTSPEVVPARTNIERAKKLFDGSQRRFVLGWIGDRSLDVVNNAVPSMVRTGFDLDLLKRLCLANSGYGTRCRPEDWKPENYFFGIIRRQDLLDLGGQEEEFISGIAFEDNEFSERLVLNGIKPEFCGEVGGLHLSHPRNYQGDIVSGINHQIYKRLKGQKVANQGRDWGLDKYITESVE